MAGIRPLAIGDFDWKEFSFRGRDFIRATVPRGDNKGLPFTIARRLAERYEVLQFFASGGCGLLLEGRDIRTGADVLIKTTLRYDGIVEYARCRDEEGFRKKLTDHRKQLQTERRIMVLLKNRGCNNIPNPNDYVFDWNPRLGDAYECDSGTWQFQDDAILSSEPYLVMERMEGKPLTEAINDGMPEHRALEVLAQVCRVLDVLHRPVMRDGREWRLVYQDLKPDNILLGDGTAASLLDLGGCRLTLGSAVGNVGAYTPGYCPPECQSSDRMTAAADSYTVGSTFYHMLTGQAPVDLLGTNTSTGGQPFVPFRNWNWRMLETRVGRTTYEFVRRCLAERPADRPQDGRELCVEIDSLMRQGRS